MPLTDQDVFDLLLLHQTTLCAWTLVTSAVLPL